MNGNENAPSVEKEQKFRITLQALTSLETAMSRLENITDKLCGSVPQSDSPDKMAEVENVARLLSDTPGRIARIESEISDCTSRLQEGLE